MRTVPLELDHVVVAARTLEEGAHMLARRLGVDIPAGGRHEKMGTHNRVMAIGGGAYLELIAVDPAAPAPVRPRWFDLDDRWLARALDDGPRVITWVLRTENLADLAPDSNLYGSPLPMARDSLRWLITVPEDGRLPGGGFLPTLIEWQCTPPADDMPDLGVRLRSLTLRHPSPEWLSSHLESLGAANLASVMRVDRRHSRIEMTLRTASGDAVLR